MRKKTGMSVGGKIAAKIAFVLLATLAVIQVCFFVLIADAGVYADSRELMEKREMERLAWWAGRNVLLQYHFYDPEAAHGEAVLLYPGTNMNFVIYRQGEKIDQIVNAENAGEYLYEFSFNATDLFDEGDLWRHTQTESVYADSFVTEYDTEYSTEYDTGQGEAYYATLYLDGDGGALGEYGIDCGITSPVFEDDIVTRVQGMVGFAYKIRYKMIAAFAFTLAAALILLAALVKNAGFVKGREGLKVRWIDKIAFDLYTFCYVIVLGTVITITAEFAAAYDYLDRYISAEYSLSIFMFLGIAFASAVTAFFTLQFLESISIRRKLGSIWGRTWTYRFLRWIKKMIKRGGSFVGKSVPLIWKTLLIFAGISFLEFVVILICYGNTEALLTFWLLEKILLLILLALVATDLRKLQEGAQKLADGDLEHKIDTERMHWELKSHGNHLNSIGVGMQNAVEERMKSERFKTELITNVSHDIKTPLTSIINYVDLLEKEELKNPAAIEYLEVLHRQSARLKKLIEDLMEASKASTGALSLNFEDCEVGVMLTQAAGEFEEKLKSKELELLIYKPEEELVIRADGRHLWRIFDNLFHNIYKYAQPKTRVYLNLEKDESRILIIFRNTSKYALNISGEELKERFVRGDSSRNTEGSGLGLSIATSLTELMGGGFELVIDGDLFKVILTFPYK